MVFEIAMETKNAPETIVARRPVELGGITLSMLSVGPRTGRPVVLIHGLGWDAARLWSGQMERLAAGGWHVLAPDLRGNGGSSPIGAPLHVPDLADDLAAALQALGVVRPILVGFSMGGMVATDLALRPEVQAAGLMIACGGVTCPPEAEAAVDAMLERARQLGPDAFAAEQAEAIFAPAWAEANPDAVADFRRWRAAMDQESLFHSFRAPYGCDYAPGLAAISCPVSVLVAAEDSFIDPEEARALAARFADARFDVMPGVGHMAPIEAPEVFAAHLAAFFVRVEGQA